MLSIDLLPTEVASHAPGAAGVFGSNFDRFENDVTGVRSPEFRSGISNGESTGIN